MENPSGNITAAKQNKTTAKEKTELYQVVKILAAIKAFYLQQIQPILHKGLHCNPSGLISVKQLLLLYKHNQ
jgi:hypothetical protein